MEFLPTWILKIVDIVGMAGMLFVIWYITNRQWNARESTYQKNLETTLDKLSDLMHEERKSQLDLMREERREQLSDMRAERDRLFAFQQDERRHDYEQQNKIAEAMQMQAALLSEIRSDVKHAADDHRRFENLILK